jgi:tetratricopeptide (TPR) repeat protein
LAVACGTRVVHVWDLRSIRRGLAEVGLDWDAPPYQDAGSTPRRPPAVEVVGAERITPRQPDAVRRATELNNQAWNLLTGPAEQRDAARGLKLIQEALKLRPGEATLLNTLGVAQYRTGKHKDAVATLEKSLAAGKGRWDGFDLFFLAMCHARLGEGGKAKECFDRAVRWVEQQKDLSAQFTDELKRFRAEAQEVLGEQR